MKKIMNLLLTAGMVVTLSGCGKPIPVDQAIPGAYRNLAEAKSYAFQAKMKLRVDEDSVNLPEEGFNDMETALSYGSPLFMLLGKEATIEIQGAYDREENRAEAELKLQLDGGDDSSTTIKSVIVATEDNAWIKIPENFAVMMGEPEVGGKYYELGTGYKIPLTPANLSQLGTEGLKIITEDLEGIALKNVKGQRGNLKVDTLSRLEITEDNLEDVLRIAVKNILPKLVELLGTSEWRSKLDLTEEDISSMRSSFEQITNEEISTEANNLKEGMELRKAFVDLGTNKSSRLKYIGAKFDLDVLGDGDTFTLKADINAVLDRYNKKQQLKYGIPTEDEVFRDGEYDEYTEEDLE
ncbi:hypothetical protein [Saccharibacillus deserti]|uniref:hypothetical protein n=1 Tax=Saccharibacillus deserti TaxID=1634444 RepID=UPI00155211B2|nr:hypothetical protein [Saccharibacillus deserti]